MLFIEYMLPPLLLPRVKTLMERDQFEMKESFRRRGVLLPLKGRGRTGTGRRTTAFSDAMLSSFKMDSTAHPGEKRIF